MWSNVLFYRLGLVLEFILHTLFLWARQTIGDSDEKHCI